MGRQAYLTRFALGRSAFQPLIESNQSGTNASSNPEASEQDDPSAQPTDSWDQVQQYDDKGYAINQYSTDLKRRMTHAQNDVLATVGVCAKVDTSSASRKNRSTMERSRIDVVKNENESGLLISTVDVSVMSLLEPWTVGVRQRLQAFRFYLGVPLATILKSDCRVWRPLKLFFAGAPAGWAFYLLEYGKGEGAMILYYYGSVALLQFIKKPGEPKKLSGPTYRLLLNSIKLVSFVLLSPIEIYALLQRLGIVSAWPLLPYPESYQSLLRGLLRAPKLPQPLNWTTGLKYTRAMAVTPLSVFFMISYTKPFVTRKLYRYLRAAFPKPTHPDKYSLQGAQEDELDSDTIPGLVNEDETQDREVTSPIDVLANDLQAIGRIWQIFWDSCSDFVGGNVGWLFKETDSSKVVLNTPPSSPSTVPALPSDPREAMESIPETIQVDGNLPQPPESVPALRPGFQDLLDPMPNTTADNSMVTRRRNARSSPRPSPLRSQSSDPDMTELPQAESANTVAVPVSPLAPSTNPLSQRRDSQFSSDVPSRLSTPPPPIEITTSTARTGTLHMNVTIPLDIAERSSHSSHGSRAPPAIPSDGDESDRGEKKPRPYHRVTALTTHAAEAMAQRLSHQLADLLFMPLETLLVRSVAMTFWSAPGLSIAARGAAGRWIEDVYPLGSWFGLGLRNGGWRGVREYAGKMVLVWGMQVGMGFVIWELSTGFMWWAGLRWYDWTKM